MIIDSAATYLTIVTASQRAEAPIGQVDKVAVGARCFAPNVRVISIPLPTDLPAEGLLGASFLRNFLVSMDYEKGKLELTTK